MQSGPNKPVSILSRQFLENAQGILASNWCGHCEQVEPLTDLLTKQIGKSRQRRAK